MSIRHGKFSYLLIPADINNPIEVRTYKGGREGQFQEELKTYLTDNAQMNSEQKAEFAKDLKSDIKGTTADVMVETMVDQASATYQVIPLTVPTAKNGHIGINAYIDNVGRIKNLPTNARASRITSTDIRGDTFLSKTFDDENEFKRLDMTLEEYEELLKNPPSKEGRWDPANALKQIQGNEDAYKALADSKKQAQDRLKKCANCMTEETDNHKLLKCGRCKAVAYCNAKCQREDWTYHKRSCPDPKATTQATQP